mmetsp:Transcript_43740/g.129475  ORF Transcript_43740/g.129475 Transcript_43740/m.129475 type:complete len:236 (-) Transcript_43740:301-1008(-)
MEALMSTLASAAMTCGKGSGEEACPASASLTAKLPGKSRFGAVSPQPPLPPSRSSATGAASSASASANAAASASTAAVPPRESARSGAEPKPPSGGRSGASSERPAPSMPGRRSPQRSAFALSSSAASCGDSLAQAASSLLSLLSMPGPQGLVSFSESAADTTAPPSGMTSPLRLKSSRHPSVVCRRSLALSSLMFASATWTTACGPSQMMRSHTRNTVAKGSGCVNMVNSHFVA